MKSRRENEEKYTLRDNAYRFFKERTSTDSEKSMKYTNMKYKLKYEIEVITSKCVIKTKN